MREEKHFSGYIFFIIILSTECGGTLFATQGSFTSANFPSIYPRDVKRDCIWIITTPSSQKNNNKNLRSHGGKKTSLTLFFGDDFNVGSEKSRTTDQCEDDYIEIREGKGFLSPYIVRYCGNRSPSPVTTTSGSLYVRFHTSGKQKKQQSNNNNGAKRRLGSIVDDKESSVAFTGFKANFKTDSKFLS